MKLLGWMHRKLRPTEPFKDFSFGGDDQQFYLRQYGTKPIKQGSGHRDYINNLPQNSFSGFEQEFDHVSDSSSATISQIFHGFLAIGTLGADATIKDPSFDISVENITKHDTQVSENELKLINDELERVLGNESVEDGYNDISRRNSASTGRSSHGSIITLSGKTINEATTTETNGNGSTNATSCPLQGYLLGSGIELPQTTIISKKECRTSLGELFQKNKLQAEENYGANMKRSEKEGDNSAVHVMKKLLKTKTLKKKMLRASKTLAGATGGTVDSDSTETKLHKILHMFHKKVHPESLGAASKENPIKAHQNAAAKRNIRGDVRYNTSEDQIFQDDDIIIIPQRPASKTNICCYEIQSNPTKPTIKSRASEDSSEHWIKTDDDYLVLELEG